MDYRSSSDLGTFTGSQRSSYSPSSLTSLSSSRTSLDRIYSTPPLLTEFCKHCQRAFETRIGLLVHFSVNREQACYYKPGEQVRPSDLKRFTLHNVYDSSIIKHRVAAASTLSKTATIIRAPSNISTSYQEPEDDITWNDSASNVSYSTKG